MTSFVFLAEGFEEVEALTPVDMLRRAGTDVKTVSITDSHKVTSSHGITVEADLTFHQADFHDAAALILPGGMPGALNLHKFEPLNDLLKVRNMNGGLIAAICAAPAVVLAPLGILDGKRATCYPGFEDAFPPSTTRDSERVVQDGQLITSNGPSSATLFGLTIVEAVCGEDVAREVASGILLYPGSMPYYF